MNGKFVCDMNNTNRISSIRVALTQREEAPSSRRETDAVEARVVGGRVPMGSDGGRMLLRER